MQYSPADLITFQSDRRPNEGGYDIYVYDPGQDTVLAISGVNTAYDETHPRLSDDGLWLVFQRGDGHGDEDILLYNRRTRLLNTLSSVNSPRERESEPDISADGRLIVYVSDAGGRAHIRLYDVTTGDAFELTGAGRQLSGVRSPTISGDGTRVAYSASTLNAPDSADIYLYDIPSASQLTPPFVNTLYREGDPELSPDGARLLFTSDRFGNDDVFECDLDTGWTDNLSDLNTAYDEQVPRYMGGSCDRILFQQRIADPAYDQLSIRAFNRAQAMLYTLPVANMLLANSALSQ
jgi:Tol biopolymer transport system component